MIYCKVAYISSEAYVRPDELTNPEFIDFATEFIKCINDRISKIEKERNTIILDMINKYEDNDINDVESYILKIADLTHSIEKLTKILEGEK